MKTTRTLTKVDDSMIFSAEKIFRDLNEDDVSLNLRVKDIENEPIALPSMVHRLADKGYIQLEDHPKRRGYSYRWLHGRLRPYQVFMLNQIVKHLKQFIIAALPTGAGKTRLAQALIQQFERTWFITPRINLSWQTLGVLLDGVDAGIVQGSHEQNADAPHLVINLQTLERRIDTLKEPDLIIWDECHYSYDRIKALIDKLPIARHVGLTATPYQADGTPLDATIIQPFKPQYFIDRGYLAPLKAMQSHVVDNSKLKRSSNGDFTQKSIDAVTDESFDGDVITATKEHLKGPTLVFAASIQHCDRLGAAYQNEGFSTLILHSKVKNPEAVLQSFRDGAAQILLTQVCRRINDNPLKTAG